MWRQHAAEADTAKLWPVPESLLCVCVCGSKSAVARSIGLFEDEGKVRQQVSGWLQGQAGLLRSVSRGQCMYVCVWLSVGQCVHEVVVSVEGRGVEAGGRRTGCSSDYRGSSEAVFRYMEQWCSVRGDIGKGQWTSKQVRVRFMVSTRPDKDTTLTKSASCTTLER